MRRLIWAPFVPEATDEGWRVRTKERQELDAARFNEAAGENAVSTFASERSC